MKMTLSGQGQRTFNIVVDEVIDHDPSLIPAIVEIDLMTFSEVTWSRFTAGLMLRHGRTFILKADDTIIGTCQLIKSWSNPQEAVLFSMSIRPGWRGRGLGTYFLQEVSDALIRSDVSALVLEVDPKNESAIRLYEAKFAFVREQVCPNEYGPGQDRLHMRKNLRSAAPKATPLPQEPARPS